MSDESAANHTIDWMVDDDWMAVKSIYQEGMVTGNATFETDVPSWEEWDGEHLKVCRFVARNENKEVVGWAALSPVSGRCVYGGVAEASIYVKEKYRGQGVGKSLLGKMIVASESAGLWTLEAGIFPENTRSIALFLSCGFRVVGYRSRLGKLHGKWRDVILMERRSQVVGES